MRRIAVLSVLGAALLVPVVGLQASASAAQTLVVGDSSCADATYANIYSAVLSANNGDTIRICPGTYTDQIADQGKNLTFVGAKAGIDGRTRATSATDETSIHGTNPVVLLSGNSSVDGFQLVQDPGSEGYGAVFYGSETLTNSVVTGASTGVWVRGPGATVERNQLVVSDGSADNPPHDLGGAGVATDQFGGAEAVIRDNAFSGDLTKGAVSIGQTDGSPVVDGVEVSGNAATLGGSGTFVLSAHTTNLAVTGNDIDATAYPATGVHLTGGNSALTISRNRIVGGGYGVEEDGTNDGGTITQNVIRNTGYGVLVNGPSGDLEVHSNIFTGNSTEAVANTFGNPDTVHAQNNFFGCNDGPTGLNGCDGVPASGLDARPYLVLTSSIATHSAQLGQPVSFTGTLNRNSDGHVVPLPVLDGEPISFTYDRGTVNPPTATLVSGKASTTVRPTSTGPGTVTATVDNATSSRSLNSTPVRPQSRISDAGTTEGNSGTHALVFRVTLTKKSTVPVTVKYTTENSSATAPSDFTAKSGAVTFPAGTTYRQISVSIRGDTVHEPNETFVVKLSSPTNGSIADGTGTGVIRNDD